VADLRGQAEQTREPASDPKSQLAQAFGAYSHGRTDEAARLAETILRTKPRMAEAHRVLGLCRAQSADLAGAEDSLRTALKLDRADPATAIALADLLDSTGRAADAEKILRAALALNRRSIPLLARLAQLLTATSRPADALLLTAKPAAEARPEHDILVQHAAAQQALGQPLKARETYERAAALYPDSPVAHHNLAASLGDLGQFAAAAHSAARAFAKGGQAPQTWLVYARALLGLGRLDEADRAFREAIARQPAYLEAHKELAQLIWMRTEDQRAATALLDTEILNHPEIPDLFALRASVFHHAGDVPTAYATIQQAIRRHPGHAGLHIVAAQFAALLPGGAPHALTHAEQAAAAAPDDDAAQNMLFAACVATGDAPRADAIAASLVQRHPLDQRALAYQATAWRLLDDPRYAALTDYEHTVRAWRMDVPDGWPDLPSYLTDLAVTLATLHPFRTHPLDQSLRHGSQAANLLMSQDPTIRAFFQAVDGPIRRHLAALGTGQDPLRARNTGTYRYRGAWSVRLRPGGFHTNHVHPEGWLSSACYISLPDTPADSQEAWIKFGEPGIPTLPPLPPEHLIKPEPGMLVLFPSYMWHGTVPFTSPGARLSVAFDLLPGG
jgi:tetratricopeptide (TPR) repeat protein